MAKEFYDRKHELAVLNERYKKGDGQMLVLYGRRRVGKTELVKEFLKKIPASEKLYFYVDLGERQETLNTLSQAMQEQLGEAIRLGSFDQFLDFLEKKSATARFVLVIDEFQRFLSTAPEFITKLQNRWDSRLKDCSIMILLVGSSIGMMQKIIESRAGALYGRASRLKISPFRYADFRMMFRQLTETEKVELFALFGGTPYYLEKAAKLANTFQAVTELVLKKNSELAEEPKNLLEYENVRTHAKYNSILHAISSGKETLKEIHDFTKIDATTLPAYLHRLDSLLDLVEKCNPVMGKEKSGRYRIKDNFFRFWYRYVYPNQTALNLGNEKLVAELIKNDINSYVGRVFEEIVKELFVASLNKKMKDVEISFENIGSWWDRNGNEIDIIAYNSVEKKIMLGEIKWTNKPLDIGVIENLITKTALIDFSGNYRYVFVSKSGFTERCIARMEELGALYLDIQDIAKLFDEMR